MPPKSSSTTSLSTSRPGNGQGIRCWGRLLYAGGRTRQLGGLGEDHSRVELCPHNKVRHLCRGAHEGTVSGRWSCRVSSRRGWGEISHQVVAGQLPSSFGRVRGADVDQRDWPPLLGEPQVRVGGQQGAHECQARTRGVGLRGRWGEAPPTGAKQGFCTGRDGPGSCALETAPSATPASRAAAPPPYPRPTCGRPGSGGRRRPRRQKLPGPLAELCAASAAVSDCEPEENDAEKQ